MNWTRKRLIELVVVASVAAAFAVVSSQKQSGPMLTFQDFQDKLKQKNYAEAYSLLSDDWRQSLTYADFVSSYDKVAATKATVRSAKIDNESATINYALVVQDLRGNETSQTASCFLTLTTIGWRINGLKILSSEATSRNREQLR